MDEEIKKTLEEIKKQFIESKLKPGMESLKKIQNLKPTPPKTNSEKQSK